MKVNHLLGSVNSAAAEHAHRTTSFANNAVVLLQDEGTTLMMPHVAVADRWEVDQTTPTPVAANLRSAGWGDKHDNSFLPALDVSISFPRV